MNDIERYDFWNREADEFLRRQKLERERLVMRWDSCTNKIPFRLSNSVSNGIETAQESSYKRRKLLTIK